MKNTTKENLEKQLKEGTTILLEMARNSCSNKISNHTSYILSEIKINQSNLEQRQKERKILNSKKKPVTLKEASEKLKEIYGNLYDINLFVYQSKKTNTLIEIRYFLKSSLDIDFFKTIENTPPMLHCKIEVPPYTTNKIKKYDINWHLGGIKHEWNLFWNKIQFYLKYWKRL